MTQNLLRLHRKHYAEIAVLIKYRASTVEQFEKAEEKLQTTVQTKQ